MPEGWWRVKYEKEGYETTWSDWLPVPPPQTEVNIGMTPVPADYHFTVNSVTENTAQLTLTNHTDENVTAHFVLAAYDISGKMIGLRFITVTLSAGESIPISLTCSDGTISKLSGFAVSPDTYEPISSVWVKNLPSQV